MDTCVVSTGKWKEKTQNSATNQTHSWLDWVERVLDTWECGKSDLGFFFCFPLEGNHMVEMSRGMFSPLKSTFMTNMCPFFCSPSLESPLARYGQVTSYSVSSPSALPTSWWPRPGSGSQFCYPSEGLRPHTILSHHLLCSQEQSVSKVWVRSRVNPLLRVIPASYEGKITEKSEREAFLEMPRAAHELLGYCCELGLLSSPTRNKSSIITQHSVGILYWVKATFASK